MQVRAKLEVELPPSMLKKNPKKGESTVTDKKVSSYTGRVHASLAWLYKFMKMVTPAVLKIIQESCKVPYCFLLDCFRIGHYNFGNVGFFYRNMGKSPT